MKPILALIFILLACLPVKSQLVLNQGDVWTYDFNSLPLTGTTNSFFDSPHGQLVFTVHPGTLQSGEMLKYETFETTSSEAPNCSGTMSFGSPLTLTCRSPGSWSDLQGTIRFTMLSGSATVDSLTLEAVVSGPSLSSYNVYSTSFNPVPEPSSDILFVFALTCGLLVDHFRKRRLA